MAKLNKLYFRVAVFALLTWLAAGSCNDLDLGMESGLITNSQITSSSVRGNQVPPENGRLNVAVKSWCASGSDSSPHLQIDLQALHIICAVSTQGNAKEDEWVETYKLQSSTDGTTWTDYHEDGQVKIFSGNVDRNSEVKHLLYEGLLTRHLRFLTLARHDRFACMRTEVFGVKKQPENIALGKATQQSSTHASGLAGKAVDGNPDTNFNSGHCTHTEENNPSWWKVDLGIARVPVSEVHIVNRLGSDPNRNKDYKITLGALTAVTSNPQCEGLYSFVNFKASAVCFNNPLMTGRYLGIMTTRQQFLQLCEVEIYSRENLAFNKPASQSSQFTSYGPGGAVDGNTNTGINSPCTHTDDIGGSGTSNPWWMVDLGQVEPVSEVYVINRNSQYGDRLDGFEIRVGTSGSNGGVANPKCGHGDTYSVPRGQGLSVYCRPSLNGRYVTTRIPGTGKVLTLCEVEVYSERRACQIQAVGLASSIAVPDDRFSASSFRVGNEPSKGRLTGGGAWAPSSNNDANDYLQIDLGYDFYICAVATQGNPSADEWTTKYKLRFSLDNSNWITYQENSTDKVFNGNSSRNGIVKHNLMKPTRTRGIRFLSTEDSGYKGLRVEVYGIEKPRAPSAPSSLTHTITAPNESHGPKIELTWSKPLEENGIITNYTVFYHLVGDPQNVYSENTTADTQAFTGDVLGGFRYEFRVRAMTILPGPNASFQVTIPEYAPSVGPENVSFSKVNETTWNISWASIPREKSYGRIKVYEVKQVLLPRGERRRRSTAGTEEINSTQTYAVLYGFQLCAQYNVSVRAFTDAGPGPYSTLPPLITSKPGTPRELTAEIIKDDYVTLKWEEPIFNTKDGLKYTVEFSGTKDYNSSFKHDGSVDAVKLTTYNVTGLVPGSQYKFNLYGTSVCGKGSKITTDVTTAMAAPLSPVVRTPTPKTIDQTKAEVELWPAEQRNGPISAYQVIVHEVSDEKDDLPSDYRSKLEDYIRASEISMKFYITAELENVPVRTVPWEFTGSDGKDEKGFVNAELQKGKIYIVYQRAITNDNGILLAGEVSKVATITVNHVPPRIPDSILPPTVLCEEHTACSLMCYAESDEPINYTWTKNGEPVFGSDVRVINNTIIVTPQADEDYGAYVCHAANSAGDVTYTITLSPADKCKLLIWVVIALSCFLLLVLVVNVIVCLMWRRRKSEPRNESNTGNANSAKLGSHHIKRETTRDPHESEPASHMELRPRPGHGQLPTEPSEYQTLQQHNKSPGYYNVGFHTKGKEEGEVYEEIDNIRS